MIICVGCESYGVTTVWLNVQQLISAHTYICIHLKILTRYELAHLQMYIGWLLSEIFVSMLLVGHLRMMMQAFKKFKNFILLVSKKQLLVEIYFSQNKCFQHIYIVEMFLDTKMIYILSKLFGPSSAPLISIFDF